MRLNLELPADAKPADRDFVSVLNTRLLRIAEFLAKLGGGTIQSGNLDMGGNRILNLGDAQVKTDGVSAGFGDGRWALLNHRHGGDAATTPPASVTQTLLLWRQGTLAVESSACPVFRLPAAKTPTEVVVLVKTAPTGANLVVKIEVDGVAWLTVTIIAGTKEIRITAGLGVIAANKNLTVSVTGVGTVFPGADLSLMLRWPG